MIPNIASSEPSVTVYRGLPTGGGRLVSVQTWNILRLCVGLILSTFSPCLLSIWSRLMLVSFFVT